MQDRGNKRIVKMLEIFGGIGKTVFFYGLVFRGLERRNDTTKIVRVFWICNSKSTIPLKKTAPFIGRFTD